MRALLNWRYYVLMVLGGISLIGIMSVPEESHPDWFMALIISKAVGFATGYAFFKLFEKWSKENRTPELDKLMKEEDDTWE